MKLFIKILVLTFVANFSFAQTSADLIFKTPTNASGSCRDYEYTCGCSGWCTSCKHAGKDYCGSTSDAIYSPGAGIITYVSSACDGSGGVGDNRGFGRTVMIVHKTNLGDVYSLYAHLSSIASDISVGKYITKGYYLGNKGKSGRGSNEIVHLHFETKTHSGLGHNIDCPGEGCVGYVKSPLLPVSSRGYYNPNNFIGSATNTYRDIALDLALPSVLKKTGVNVNVQIKSPFSNIYKVDMRLALYNISNAYIGDIQAWYNMSIPSGVSTVNFSKNSLSSIAGTYKLQLEYKVPGSSTWLVMPTTYNSNTTPAPVSYFTNPRTIGIVNSLTVPNGNTEIFNEDLQVRQSSNVNLDIKNTVVGNKELLKVNIYPIPANDVMTIDIEKTALKGIGLTITDVTGKIVKVAEHDELNGSDKIILEIEDFKNGIYFLNLRCDDGEISTHSVVIQR